MDEALTPENKPNAYGKSNWVKLILTYLIIGGVLYAVIYYFVLAKRGAGYGQNQTPPIYTQPNAPVRPSTRVKPGASVPETQNKITLTSNGFTPRTLTIKAGDTVTWQNNSGVTSTVNSDPHPLHTNYPPLNLGQLNDGESLSLKFDKAGTYGYHNHMNPSQTGKIIVE